MGDKYTNMNTGINAKVIYPELSYKIVGAAFNVFNDISYGMNEKYYQHAFAKALECGKVPFKKEQMVKLNYDGRSIGTYFLDFVADDKIIVELKVRQRLGYIHIKQVMSYLKVTGYKLAILIYFTRDGIKYRRIVNVI